MADKELPKELAELATTNAKNIAAMYATQNSLRNLHRNGIDAGSSLVGLGWYKKEIETFTKEFYEGMPKETFSKRPEENKNPGLKDIYPAAIKKRYNKLVDSGKTPEEAAKEIITQEKRISELLKRDTHRLDVNLEHDWIQKYIKAQGADTTAEKKRLKDLMPEFKKVNNEYLSVLEKDKDTTRETIRELKPLYEEIGRPLPDLEKFRSVPKKEKTEQQSSLIPADSKMMTALNQFTSGSIPDGAKLGFNAAKPSASDPSLAIGA